MLPKHWRLVGLSKTPRKVSEDEIPDIKSPACELEIPLLSINQDKITGFS
jgi:hypothetical protein